MRPEKFPKRFSFGGGRVRFFLLCRQAYLGQNDLSGRLPEVLFMPALVVSWLQGNSLTGAIPGSSSATVLAANARAFQGR